MPSSEGSSQAEAISPVSSGIDCFWGRDCFVSASPPCGISPGQGAPHRNDFVPIQRGLAQGCLNGDYGTAFRVCEPRQRRVSGLLVKSGHLQAEDAEGGPAVNGVEYGRIGDMTRLIPAFSFSYFFFLTAPVVLRMNLGRGAMPTVGAMLDLLTPFVLIGLYGLLYLVDAQESLPNGPLGLSWSMILFAFFAILFAEGHSMHLTANSIGTFLTRVSGSGAYTIAYFYDEVLGHILWRLGVLGLTGVVLARHWGNWRRAPRWALLAGVSAAFGLTNAVAAVESQTVPMDLLGSLAIAGTFGARWWRGRAVPGDALFAFFGLAHALVVVVLAVWGLYFAGFPEPSELLGY